MAAKLFSGALGRLTAVGNIFGSEGEAEPVSSSVLESDSRSGGEDGCLLENWRVMSRARQENDEGGTKEQGPPDLLVLAVLVGLVVTPGGVDERGHFNKVSRGSPERTPAPNNEAV